MEKLTGHTVSSHYWAFFQKMQTCAPQPVWLCEGAELPEVQLSTPVLLCYQAASRGWAVGGALVISTTSGVLSSSLPGLLPLPLAIGLLVPPWVEDLEDAAEMPALGLPQRSPAPPYLSLSLFLCSPYCKDPRHSNLEISLSCTCDSFAIWFFWSHGLTSVF